MERDREALRHLLLSFPDLQVKRGGTEIVDGVVEGAVYHVKQQTPSVLITTVGEVIAAIEEIAELKFEQAEIVASLERLAAVGSVGFRNEQHTAFVFARPRLDSLAALLEQRNRSVDAVRSEWAGEVSRTHVFTEEQLTRLWAGLDRFVASLVNKHAAEAAAFLYMRDDAGQARFNEALNKALPRIEQEFDEDLRVPAAQLVPAFFEDTSNTRASYLADRLLAAFLFHLLSLDPRAAELVREHVSEKVLYLDTNVLYRLLGMHGPALAFGPATAADVASQLSCRLVVAQETVNEFVRSLRADTYRIRHVPLTRDAYKRIVAEHPSDQWSFMRIFYQEYLSGRIKNVDEFERKYSNVGVLLESWKIEVDESAALSDQERAQPDFIDLYADLDRWQRGEKHPETVAHDVFLLRCVRRARGDADPTPGRVKHWLLTHDSSLARFSIYHATATRLPAAMLADDWLQIARPFLPRTLEYERAFVAMLRHPLVYQRIESVPLDHVVEALSRLERYQELPEKLAAAMVADQEFLRRLQKAPSDEAVREVVDLKVAELAGAVAAENKELRGRMEAVDARVGQLEGTLQQKESERLAALRRAETAGFDAQARLEQLEAARTQAEQAGAQKVAEITVLSDTVGKLRIRLRWLSYALAAVIVLAFAALVLLSRWNQLSLSRSAVVMIWTGVTLAALLGVPLRRRALEILGIVIGLAGMVWMTISLW